MIDRQALLGDLRRQLRLLERDLAERAESVPEMAAALEAEYRATREAERTAATFNVWRAGELTQAAVAWLLACVFVRFIEDNGLIGEPLIGGPDGGNERAAHRQTRYFREHPTDTDRDYLLDGFAAVARLPAMAPLYDRVRNPVWRLGISGDAARDLLAFWRTTAPDTGALRHDFADPAWDTRFLGDLYQDLSDDAKKRYALLQTPEFVEEFILDRTLTPALDEFGLADTRLIDPACGSGHFLLGAFDRLLRQWFNREPGTPERALVQRALDAVYGVDINPFATAIARFRLLLAALRASGITRLRDAPAFRINVAAGDSLLHGRRFGELDLGSADQHNLSRQAEFSHAFQAEDLDALNRILGQQYHVVVGNPPYITPKDPAVRQLYRSRYATCYMKYAMSVPFTERCFGLALRGSGTQSAGYLGIITANSFMKREFGKKLIESFLPGMDLTHVIDTSGAYIPGHGTPTVILFGRNRAPVSDAVRVVMGRRGEPTPPTLPEEGIVWRSIVVHIDRSGSGNEWLDVADLPRVTFASHPWSVSDTLANDLKLLLDRNQNRLESVATSIGPASFTGTDDAFVAPKGMFRRLGVDPELVRSYVVGELIRDWSYEGTSAALVPYNGANEPFAYDVDSAWGRYLWRYRTTIGGMKSFGGRTRLECGDDWWTWYRWIPKRYAAPRFISFAEVATNNHFTFDRGGRVFSQTAPVIKLQKDASETDHLALVGILNCSVACFWLQQSCHNKGGPGGAYSKDEKWHDFYQFGNTKLKSCPIPNELPSYPSKRLDRLVVQRQSRLPAQLADRLPMDQAEIEAHQGTAADLLARMIALQEELDWECYRLYGIIDEDCRHVNGAGGRPEPPPLALGERAFEIVMARRMAAGELETRWFERHGSTPVIDLPAHWPDDYRALVARRIELIESDRFIGLLERPEYKRRWNVESWRDQERRALRTWLLDRLESPAYWPEPRLTTVRELAGRAAADADFQQVAARFLEGAHGDLDPLIAELVAAESVPALPVQRYKPSGLAKRADWERVWAAQRREDEIDAETAAAIPREPNETADDYAVRLQAEQRGRKRDELGDLTPPPKYRSADFLKPGYWRLRGALDVPKERFVSFPDMSRDHDPTLLVGWAGWDAPTLCRAVATYYTHAHEREGWSAARLTPLLAVIRESLPWLKQWHNDIDPEYNERLGDFYETFVSSQLAHFGLAQDDLRQWAPERRS